MNRNLMRLAWILAAIVFIALSVRQCSQANATAIISMGVDQQGAVGDTVYAEVMIDVVVPQDTLSIMRLLMAFDSTKVRAVSVVQGRDAPGIWIFTNNFLGWECASFVFLMAYGLAERPPSWDGHAATVGFEILRPDEAVVSFCSYGLTGDNQLYLYHDGVEHCTEAWKPWMYSDLQDGTYDCVRRLESNDVLVINPVSATTLPVEDKAWGGIKALYR